MPIQTSPTPRARLFCLPFAGGGAAVFRAWRGALPPDIEVCAIQLPGRESRFGEPPLTTMDAVVDGVLAAIRPLLDRPFALFGHSMGAMIGFEAARRLARDGQPAPALLAVSGRRAPFLPSTRAMHTLPDDDFIAGLRELRGTPAEVLENDELMRLVLPILRADFRVVETYRYADGPPLQTRLLVLGGENDTETDAASLDAWRKTTHGAFRKAMLPGDHFFVTTHRDRLLPILSAELGDAFARPPQD